MPESILETGHSDKSALWSLPYVDRQLIVVTDNILQRAEELVRQLGATTKRVSTIVDRQKADEKADKVIRQTVAQVAIAAVFPAYVNWTFTSALVGVGVMRIGHRYGVSLNRKNARKLVTQFTKAAGLWFFSMYVSTKVFAALFETTVIGYGVGASIDVFVCSAIAYAIGTTAKAYFQGVHAESELGEIMRTSFKTAKKELNKDTLKKMREERKGALYGDEQLHAILSSERGSDIVRRVLLHEPDIANKVNLYMAKKGRNQLQGLSLEDIKMLDDEGGVAHEIWELVSDETDVRALLASIEAQDVLPENREDRIPLWFQERSILVIGYSEAEKLKFPPGHPRKAVLYAGHPRAENIYYPAAQFHRCMFEHKFCEAIRILRSLGATKIEVEHVKGKSTEWSSKLGIAAVAAEVLGEIRGVSQSGSRIFLQASYAGTTYPSLPEDVAWYVNEPLWQEIAEGRLKHGLKRFNLLVTYEDDFGINGDLTGKVEEAAVGLGLGGKFEEHEVTVWRLAGDFCQ